MNTDNEHFNSIAVEALSLSMRERGDLAARLLKSLDDESADDDTANLAVVKERLKKYRDGELTSRPTEDVIQEMREKFCL